MPQTMSVSQIRGTKLSRREAQIKALVALGNTTRQIAEMLSISAFTVSNHRKRILKKKGVTSMRHLSA